VYFEQILPMGETADCPRCGSIAKKVLPSSFGFKCQRFESDLQTKHKHWFETEGQRRLRLPDSHPDKLVPVRKSDDLMHGDGSPPPIKKTTESEIAVHLDEWKAAGSPSTKKVKDMIVSGQI
jgi:hypothetical protein